MSKVTMKVDGISITFKSESDAVKFLSGRNGGASTSDKPQRERKSYETPQELTLETVLSVRGENTVLGLKGFTLGAEDFKHMTSVQGMNYRPLYRDGAKTNEMAWFRKDWKSVEVADVADVAAYFRGRGVTILDVIIDGKSVKKIAKSKEVLVPSAE